MKKQETFYCTRCAVEIEEEFYCKECLDKKSRAIANSKALGDIGFKVIKLYKIVHTGRGKYRIINNKNGLFEPYTFLSAIDAAKRASELCVDRFTTDTNPPIVETISWDDICKQINERVYGKHKILGLRGIQWESVEEFQRAMLHPNMLEGLEENGEY
jgi:hypothetical protein